MKQSNIREMFDCIAFMESLVLARMSFVELFVNFDERGNSANVFAVSEDLLLATIETLSTG